MRSSWSGASRSSKKPGAESGKTAASAGGGGGDRRLGLVVAIVDIDFDPEAVHLKLLKVAVRIRLTARSCDECFLTQDCPAQSHGPEPGQNPGNLFDVA